MRSTQPVLPAGSLYTSSAVYPRYTMRDAGNREVTFDYGLEPGTYVLVPSLQNRVRRRRFYLRIYTETQTESAWVLLIVHVHFPELYTPVQVYLSKHIFT